MKTSLSQAATPQHRRPRLNTGRTGHLSSGQHPRRRFLGLAAGAAALPAVLRVATAQVYPARPVTMIVPFAAGGSADVVGRIISERMTKSLGQPVIIENVGGADGSIGTGRAARARGDGYMITIGNEPTHVLNGALYSLPYNVLNDFTPISPLVTFPQLLLARKTMPAKDLNELIMWLKRNPNNVSVAIGATTVRLMAALFRKETGAQFTFVPYRGGAPAMQDMMAGQVDLTFNAPDQLPLVRAGSIKAYAVTSAERLALAPEIPTFVEMGLPALSYSSWFGLFAPRGTPRDIIGKLNAAVVEALADPVARLRITGLSLEVLPREQLTPEALGAKQRAGVEKWWPIIKDLGIKVQ